jgi:hypothetical protein
MGRVPTLPVQAAHVWRWFCELDAARQSGGFGPSPITYRDIDAYRRLTREVMQAWEVRAIRAIDNAILQEITTAAARK